MLAAAVVPLLAYPRYLGCGGKLETGAIIMERRAIDSDNIVAQFEGKECGLSRILRGEALNVSFTEAAQFVIEVTGGASFTGPFQAGLSTCGATRVYSEWGNRFEVDTTYAMPGAEISVKVGFASFKGTVRIGECSLIVASNSTPAPPFPPRPPPQPPRVPPSPTQQASPAFWWHAAAMSLAWLIVAPAGMQVARFGKRAEAGEAGTTTTKGKARWFLWHRRLQLLVVALTAGGVAAANVAVDADALKHFRTTHSMVGVVTAGLVLVQALGGLLRPPHEHRLRLIWRVSHGVLGVSTWVLAIVACILGALRMPKVTSMYALVEAQDDQSLLIAVIVVAASSVVAVIALEVLAYTYASKRPALRTVLAPGDATVRFFRADFHKN